MLLQARPYWLHIAAIFLVGLAATPLALLAPVPLQLAVDAAIANEPMPAVIVPFVDLLGGDTVALLIVLGGMVVLLALLTQLHSLVQSLLRSYTSARLVLDFRAALFRHVQRLSLSYHDTKGVNDTMYRIQYDAQAIQWIAIDGVIPLITALVMVVAMAAVAASIDLQLTIIALTVAPLMVLLTRSTKHRLRSRSKEAKELDSSSLGVLQEALGAIRVVKAFGQEDREHERYVTRSSASVAAAIRLAFAEGAVGLLVGVGTALGTAFVLGVGALHVYEGRLTLGELLLLMGYLSQLYAPLKTLSKGHAMLQSSLAGAERALALLDQSPDVPPPSRPVHITRARGRVTFQDVSFAYPSDPLRPILQHATFEIPAGARVGITGRTGSGKTTLAGLLMRFHDPVHGAVLLDGVDLRDLDLSDLRRQYTLVLQEPVLFAASIAENIRYSDPSASFERIVAAARAAGAHDFITQLPEGYETRVGDRGMRLSGGERQRISIARAFLRDAPILVLDEPTSSLDVATEASIMEAMERLMQGRTTFIIAHRLATLDRCDLHLELPDCTLRPADRRIAVPIVAPHRDVEVFARVTTYGG